MNHVNAADPNSDTNSVSKGSEWVGVLLWWRRDGAKTGKNATGCSTQPLWRGMITWPRPPRKKPERFPLAYRQEQGW